MRSAGAYRRRLPSAYARRRRDDRGLLRILGEPGAVQRRVRQLVRLDFGLLLDERFQHTEHVAVRRAHVVFRVVSTVPDADRHHFWSPGDHEHHQVLEARLVPQRRNELLLDEVGKGGRCVRLQRERNDARVHFASGRARRYARQSTLRRGFTLAWLCTRYDVISSPHHKPIMSLKLLPVRPWRTGCFAAIASQARCSSTTLVPPSARWKRTSTCVTSPGAKLRARHSNARRAPGSHASTRPTSNSGPPPGITSTS